MTPDYLGTYNQNYNNIANEVNKYADELVKQSQGDYDYAAKYIEANYKQALGEDDSSRRDFLKQVANALEQKVGRIAYDYQTGTYRAKQDQGTATTRLNENTSTALQRLNEDDKVLRTQTQQQAQQDRASQNSTLNSRGLVSGARGEYGGLGGQNVNQLETNINDRFGALDRTLNRNTQDTTQAQTRGLFDINQQADRSIQDLTTGARRQAQDAQLGHDQSIEQAQRSLERAKQAAEAQRRTSLNQASSYSDYLTRGTYGLG